MFVVRWVDDDLQSNEEFLGLYQLPNIEASTLISMVKDCLIRFNLSIAKIRGQCYDGASNMSGKRTGVAKKISDEEPRALFMHCYGHSLSLAAADTIKKCRLLKSVLETSYEIIKLVKFSPRREALLDRIKSRFPDSSPGIRVLCPTRWTVQAKSLESIFKNYKSLQTLWEEAVSTSRDTEMIARMRGVAAQMNKFQFLFGLVLCELLLSHTDNLSRSLQSKTCSAAEGQLIADMTKKTIGKIRNDNDFELFWKKVEKSMDEICVDEPELPRKRKTPARYDVGSAPAEFHATPKLYFRQIYFEAIDLLVEAIGDRFDQPGYRTYIHLEALLLKALKKEDYQYELDFIIDFYGTDLNKSLLDVQLKILGQNLDEKATILDIRNYFATCSSAERELLCEVHTAMKLITVMPATNSSSERSFSAMRRVKTYLRSTMTQERLNYLMMLHIHKDMTDCIDLASVANDFVCNNEHRLNIFGNF